MTKGRKLMLTWSLLADGLALGPKVDWGVDSFFWHTVRRWLLCRAAGGAGCGGRRGGFCASLQCFTAVRETLEASRWSLAGTVT